MLRGVLLGILIGILQIVVGTYFYFAGGHAPVAAKVYKEHCAVCHGLPGEPKTAIADGMFPPPPQLFRGTGVTDDEAWETYWKVSGGLRMTGMPGFSEHLGETKMWQVSVLLKNADKISSAVKAELASPPAWAPAPAAAPSAAPAPP